MAIYKHWKFEACKIHTLNLLILWLPLFSRTWTWQSVLRVHRFGQESFPRGRCMLPSRIDERTSSYHKQNTEMLFLLAGDLAWSNLECHGIVVILFPPWWMHKEMVLAAKGSKFNQCPWFDIAWMWRKTAVLCLVTLSPPLLVSSEH